jgi:hypothetical protein
MRARREVVAAVAKRYQSAERSGQGAHPRRAVRDDGLASQARGARTSATRDCVRRGRQSTARAQAQNGVTIKDALMALWEASDRVCGKRLKVMIRRCCRRLSETTEQRAKAKDDLRLSSAG